ncbi:hypothetical protein A9P82_05910 [Arachidicoccus ginsenosidimutans]|uniref:glycoside hydrolase family 99-like domain-containing protein n=1 Tax=Arachidicoccus sp. BS20 TaxID=1850526 RepID=UPI0007F10651|nr:glycoside hydrolase family 99-like domain-containing protein [Arachidicoccus sp. BS20]ANI88866.1 hypothetical protein A9P82_05910 [Arachidicoccus sp. BS20]
MIKYSKLKFIIVIVLVLASGFKSYSQADIRLGVFYFDGWTGRTNHITSSLKNNFTERQPIWGWITSTPAIMKKQIDVAADAGIEFFNFCWYPNSKGKSLLADPKNQAMKLFMKEPNTSRLKFSIVVVNNGTYTINKNDWNALENYWISLMKAPNYLKSSNGHAILSFFTLKSLLITFGNEGGVKAAFTSLRKKALVNGIRGIDIAVCDAGDAATMQLADRCGADYISAYNNHSYGFEKAKAATANISAMNTQELKLWTLKKPLSRLKQIPTITLNWDPRPATGAKSKKYFSGYSGQSIYNQVISCRKWIAANPGAVSPDKLVFIYAWNEYVEGAWLTPSAKLGYSLINGLKRGLSDSIN